MGLGDHRSLRSGQLAGLAAGAAPQAERSIRITGTERSKAGQADLSALARMPNIEFLSRRVGQVIEEVLAEVWREGDVSSLLALWIRFADGKPLVLGCAGDGGVFVRRAELSDEDVDDRDSESRFDPMAAFAGAVMRAVVPSCDGLEIDTSAGRIGLRNDDDELRLTVSGGVAGTG